MSEENVQVVRGLYNAWNRGDMKAFGELFAPDARVYPLDYWPGSEVWHGREEIVRQFTEVRDPLERNEAVPERLVEGDDCLVAAHHWRGVLRGTEDEIEARVGAVATVREGKITEMSFFRTFAEALEAAGLSE